ncbi:alpha/beta fold hydrolase [Achromobacter anxifer]|jgi:pimeloyl-ACP methyl ester carboxylesterase|uniref:alpha/beta fold hydrolase n=1 Tax=Achromobacter anxifer TaxID=1287737 RepID=UPI00155B987B|nr:alpha/beta hydrolase [Achromobacter anxifer]MDF8360814.1 alpha/beta hydrolase [Achromobacter anxifer]CAB5511521.1 Epoxide hydrolase A [Achromobacter anxifer]
MIDLETRDVAVNGITLHVTAQGEGPLVVLCHGFPETAYAWRHQLPALARAGFRAVAPDLRGYGASDSPADAAAFTTLDVIGDLVALIESEGADDAVIVGGDWGASIAWQAAQLRPDRFRAVVALGVPMMRRAPVAPCRLFPKTESAAFYTHYFNEPGVAESEFERDISATLRAIYFAASGDAGPRDDPRTPNPFGMVATGLGLLHSLPVPQTLPAWLTPSDLAAFVQSYTTSGFRGGLNYYRNLDRNWALQGALEGKRVEVPALYLVGERDTGLAIPGMAQIIEAMPALVPQLRAAEVIPGAGHWLQQEAPEAVNKALVDFLRSL